MDSKLVNDKAETYGDRTIRVNPAIMRRLGLETRGIHLKIDEFNVSCVPFDLSLVGASVLAFLSAGEVAFFEKIKGGSRALHLVCRSPGTTKAAPFFIRCDILALRKPDPDSPYCFIDLRFRVTPFLLREILVAWFIESDEAESFWDQAQEEGLAPGAIALVFPRPHLEILKDGVVADRLRTVHLSPRRARLFGEYEGPPPGKGEMIDFEARDGEEAFIVRGPCVEFAPFAEAPGFAFIEIEPQFNPILATRMRRAMDA